MFFDLFFDVGRKFFKPRYAVNKFGLTVAVNARDTHDFARMHLKTHVLYGKFFVNLAFDAQFIDFQNDVARDRLVLIDLKLHLTTDHHFGKFFLRRVLDFDGADVLALS